MTNYSIINASAKGEQLVEITDRIMDALEGVPVSLKVISCITLALVLQKSNMNENELQNLVMAVSQYICTLLATSIDSSNSSIIMN